MPKSQAVQVLRLWREGGRKTHTIEVRGPHRALDLIKDLQEAGVRASFVEPEAPMRGFMDEDGEPERP